MIAVIVVAAGAGARLGAGAPKAFVPIAGAPLLQHALAPLAELSAQVQLVLVVPPGTEPQAAAAAAAAFDSARLIVVPGGADRQASVQAGLAALNAEVRVVLVHDVARPLVPVQVFESVIAAILGGAVAAVPVLPIVDTVRRRDGEALGETLDREALSVVQTPQGFERAVLEAALTAAGASGLRYTDDAGAVAAAGHRVRAVAGAPEGFKITVTADLARAAALIEPPELAGLRVGQGADVHAFAEGGVLRLGALDWPGEPALAGHSDGDALVHAVVDALLSAAGLGDIGTVFGTDDPRYSGAAGETFLAEAIDRLVGAGWRPVSVSAEVIAARPRIGPRRAELERRLTALVGAPVTVSGTTSDGLGITGDGSGIAAVATALIAALPAGTSLTL